MNIEKYRILNEELPGSIGDLGTFLPYVIGAIAIGGLDATGVFTMFGLMYIFTGWFYRVPVPVQPMKVIGAAILVHHLTAGEVAAAGYMMGFTLLFLGLTGLVDKLAKFTPQSVTSGIQAGLGISLALLGITFIKTDLFLGLPILLLMLLLFGNKKIPASIIGVLGGTVLAFIIHPELSFPHLTPGVHLPTIFLPELADFNRGFTLAYLPQLPLTLTNSILVTAVLAHDLYSDRAKKVTEKNLCLTLGIGNLISVPMGGYIMCHGSGGMAAHHRFGGRTGATTIIMGSILLLTGIILGPSGLALMEIIPKAVLGSLLFYSGIDLVTGVKNIKGNNNFYSFIIVVIVSVAVNPAVAFIIGIPLVYLLNKGWVKV